MRSIAPGCLVLCAAIWSSWAAVNFIEAEAHIGHGINEFDNPFGDDDVLPNHSSGVTKMVFSTNHADKSPPRNRRFLDLITSYVSIDNCDKEMLNMLNDLLLQAESSKIAVTIMAKIRAIVAKYQNKKLDNNSRQQIMQIMARIRALQANSLNFELKFYVKLTKLALEYLSASSYPERPVWIKLIHDILIRCKFTDDLSQSNLSLLIETIKEVLHYVTKNEILVLARDNPLIYAVIRPRAIQQPDSPSQIVLLPGMPPVQSVTTTKDTSLSITALFSQIDGILSRLSTASNSDRPRLVQSLYRLCRYLASSVRNATNGREIITKALLKLMQYLKPGELLNLLRKYSIFRLPNFDLINKSFIVPEKTFQVTDNVLGLLGQTSGNERVPFINLLYDLFGNLPNVGRLNDGILLKLIRNLMPKELQTLLARLPALKSILLSHLRSIHSMIAPADIAKIKAKISANLELAPRADKVLFRKLLQELKKPEVTAPYLPPDTQWIPPETEEEPISNWYPSQFPPPELNKVVTWGKNPSVSKPEPPNVINNLVTDTEPISNWYRPLSTTSKPYKIDILGKLLSVPAYQRPTLVKHIIAQLGNVPAQDQNEIFLELLPYLRPEEAQHIRVLYPLLRPYPTLSPPPELNKFDIVEKIPSVPEYQRPPLIKHLVAQLGTVPAQDQNQIFLKLLPYLRPKEAEHIRVLYPLLRPYPTLSPPPGLNKFDIVEKLASVPAYQRPPLIKHLVAQLGTVPAQDQNQIFLKILPYLRPEEAEQIRVLYPLLRPYPTLSPPSGLKKFDIVEEFPSVPASQRPPLIKHLVAQLGTVPAQDQDEIFLEILPYLRPEEAEQIRVLYPSLRPYPTLSPPSGLKKFDIVEELPSVPASQRPPLIKHLVAQLGTVPAQDQDEIFLKILPYLRPQEAEHFRVLYPSLRPYSTISPPSEPNKFDLLEKLPSAPAYQRPTLIKHIIAQLGNVPAQDQNEIFLQLLPYLRPQDVEHIRVLYPSLRPYPTPPQGQLEWSSIDDVFSFIGVEIRFLTPKNINKALQKMLIKLKLMPDQTKQIWIQLLAKELQKYCRTYGTAEIQPTLDVISQNLSPPLFSYLLSMVPEVRDTNFGVGLPISKPTANTGWNDHDVHQIIVCINHIIQARSPYEIVATVRQFLQAVGKYSLTYLNENERNTILTLISYIEKTANLVNNGPIVPILRGLKGILQFFLSGGARIAVAPEHNFGGSVLHQTVHSSSSMHTTANHFVGMTVYSPNGSVTPIPAQFRANSAGKTVPIDQT